MLLGRRTADASSLTVAARSSRRSRSVDRSGSAIAAYVAIAVYDSVIAVKGGYEPFAVDVDAPWDASAEAAVAAAAHRVLAHHLEAQAATILDPAYEASLATIPNGFAKRLGVAVGEHVAGPPHRPTRRRRLPGAGDLHPTGAADPRRVDPNRADTTDRCVPRADGAVQPPRAQPVPTGRTPDRCPPGSGPREYNEVQAIGSITSTTRTADQTLAARFWAEPPVQQARGSFRRFVDDHDLDIVEASRFMAMVSVTYADALIACFDAKYHYAYWRPVTAIHAGDTDGNAATIADPAWSPLLAGTPNHPKYPSAHSCITPTAGRVIARFLGTRRIDFTVPSLTGLGDRHFTRPRDLTYEVGNARIWGGIHYRSAIEDGTTIARHVARWVGRHHFQPEA